MTEDQREANRLAQQLEAQHRRRQALTNAIHRQAQDHIYNMPGDPEVLLLDDLKWVSDVGNPLGVVGLVAGKLVEEFGRPALVLAPDQTDGLVRGSARSTPEFDIHEALAQSKDILELFGGHSAAAGLTVKKESVSELNQRLCAFARSHSLNGATEHQPIIRADQEITLAEITDDLLEDIGRLAPFGTDNPYPLFMARGVRVLDTILMGNSGAHLKLMVADQTNISRAPMEAVAFRMGDMADAIKDHPSVDLLFHVERHVWRDTAHLQLRVRDLRISTS
jgi:single-stranded-DNA-specific exonuclease